ncbi:MAG: diguanylate cyclase [Candidatus Omnitrophica bacterium]|nr:diguanylate cyclase [Candidatus Omnitrophota bacterium]
MPEENHKGTGAESKPQSVDLAYVDDLTSLFNRRYLNKVLIREISRAKNENKSISIFMMDCDNLKKINDSYGHLSGDKVLVNIADILRSVIGEEATIVRYAGDEFTLVFFDKGLDESVDTAGKILKLIKDNKVEDKRGAKNISVTMSMGLAVYPDDADSASGLLEKADQALYSSKRTGRNRVSTVKDIMAEVRGRDLLANALPCKKFIDRQKELAHIQASYKDAEKGAKKFVLVKGPQGIGKTRFMLELFSPDKIYPSLLLMCSREDINKKYGSIADAFSSFLEFMDAGKVLDALNSLDDAHKAALFSMVRKIRDLPVKYSGHKSPKAEDLKDEDIVNAFLRFMKELKIKIIPVLADDIIWIDSGSLEIIKGAIKERGTEWGMLIAGSISDDMVDIKQAPRTPFSIFMNENDLAKTCDVLELKPLKDNDVSEFFDAVFSCELISQDFKKKMFAACSGIPVRVESLIRRMFVNKIVYAKGGEWALNTNELDKMINSDDYRGPENRTYMRLHTDCAVDYVRLSDDLKPAYNVVEDSYSKNISATGVKFVSNKRVPMGSFLELRIRIPSSDRLIAAIGKVLRCEADGGKCFNVAISFIWISQSDKELIDEYVRTKK